MRHVLLALSCLAALGACSNPLKTGRYLIDPPASAERLPDRLGMVELKEVSLPDYATGDEIAWQTADGAVRLSNRQLWADTPPRAFTLTLARAISDLSGAMVIAEPWPLAEPPRRKLEVHVEKALAQAGGDYRLSGRYFIAEDRVGGSNQARSFDIIVPLASDRPGAIAQAQSRAIAQLARQIAVIGGPGRTVETKAPRLDSYFADSLAGF